VHALRYVLLIFEITKDGRATAAIAADFHQGVLSTAIGALRLPW
jgi:hypothetical protein